MEQKFIDISAKYAKTEFPIDAKDVERLYIAIRKEISIIIFGHITKDPYWVEKVEEIADKMFIKMKGQEKELVYGTSDMTEEPKGLLNYN